MRNFKDSHGVIAWIYDEKTHPFGLENPDNKPKEEVKEMVYDSRDLNKDGKVSLTEKIISRVKKRK